MQKLTSLLNFGLITYSVLLSILPSESIIRLFREDTLYIKRKLAASHYSSTLQWISSAKSEIGL